MPHSTVGYERRFNWAFDIANEDDFVKAVLAGQPEPPKYFAEMKRINKEGPGILGGFNHPERLAHDRLAELLASGALVVDTRQASDYAAGHVPGTISIALNQSFNTWAGWLIGYDRDFYLIIDDEGTHGIDEAVRDLAMIGLDRVAGYFGSNVVAGWAAAGGKVAIIPQITTTELAERLRTGDVDVLDVRGRAEWEAGHLPGVKNIPVGYLTDRMAEIPRDKPLVLHCQSGTRSAIAASLLRAKGLTNVINLTGGFADWQEAGYPVDREASAEEMAGVR